MTAVWAAKRSSSIYDEFSIVIKETKSVKKNGEEREEIQYFNTRNHHSATKKQVYVHT